MLRKLHVCEDGSLSGGVGPETLKLTNDGQLELFFFGVGSANAKKHAHNNAIVIKGDTHIAIDFGTRMWMKADEFGIKTTDIKTVFPTHSHGDHVGGIEEWALDHRYPGVKFMGGDRPDMIITDHYRDILWGKTLCGGLEWNEMEPDLGKPLYFTSYFNQIQPKWKIFESREIWNVNYKGIELDIFRTMHVPDSSTDWSNSFISYGLVIDKTIFYSGDTRCDPELVSVFYDDPTMNIRAWFHDIQFFEKAVHSSKVEMEKKYPAEVLKKMYPMHLADNWESQDCSKFAGWAEEGVIYSFD